MLQKDIRKIISWEIGKRGQYDKTTDSLLLTRQEVKKIASVSAKKIFQSVSSK